MKGLGAALVLGGAFWFWWERRRAALEPIRLGRALLGDLAVLRCRICIHRAPLPQILEEFQGALAERLWRPLGAMLDEGLPQCWSRAAAALPEPLDRLLEPLGPLLPQGGERLAEAIEETREELAGFLREETARQANQGRVHAALCLSGACLTVLVLL